MPVAEYGLGRLQSIDDRDRGFLMANVVPERPTRTTRHWWAPQALNQGTTPQCVGYSWRMRLTAHPLYFKGGVSASEIYHAAQKVDEWPGEDYPGTSVRAGAKVLQDLGLIERYVWAWDAETARRFLLSEGTVIIGSLWTHGMDEPVGGMLRPAVGQIRGGHAYLAVGYSRHRGAFRILNSWGQRWGENGRAWLLGEDLDWLLERDGEICAPTERMP